SAFKSRRCLVMASGFYEWRKLDAKNKQPYYISLTNGAPMPMAGLWEVWKLPEGETVESCTIITHTANDMMEPLHDRMPVILTHALVDPWLDPAINDPAAIQPMLEHFPADEMQAWPVSKDVGNVRNQGERLIEAITVGA
ncbi:SOS response-associated peptidase, partial [Schlesneria paludicola]|uniref:SOS response-associated peptidase n=1 Tax=Schlesneria paludicola TaxID=360056 RepID=UPI00029AE90F